MCKHPGKNETENHNDISKECAVLSDSERANFFLSLMQLSVSKCCW